MKYLLPLVICLFLATVIPAQAQDEAAPADTGYAQDEVTPEPSVDASAQDAQGDMDQLRDRAAEFKAQLAEEMPTNEELKALADKYNVKAPTADQIRNYASQHSGKIDQAKDYARRFQEFRAEQAAEQEIDNTASGALAPE